MDFAYDLSDWQQCLISIVVLNGIALLGLFAARPHVRRMHKQADHNEIVNYYFTATGVFYGLALGLTAVGSWENFSQAGDKVSREASQVAALWRDTGGYPEPTRGELRDELRAYTRYVIDEAWPMQRAGKVPPGGTVRLTAMYDRMLAFTPASRREEILHQESIHRYNELITARRERLQAVNTTLPGSLWAALRIGALLTVMATFLLDVESARLHVLLTVLFTTTIAVLLFVTFAMDNPFRGETSIGPEPFEIVFQQLMK